MKKNLIYSIHSYSLIILCIDMKDYFQQNE